jgi:hypothetical protein
VLHPLPGILLVTCVMIHLASVLQSRVGRDE